MKKRLILCRYLVKGVVEEYGPRSLLSWILDVWDTNADKVFDIQYLHLWGSRYAPDLQNGEFYRWFSSGKSAFSILHGHGWLHIHRPGVPSPSWSIIS